MVRLQQEEPGEEDFGLDEGFQYHNGSIATCLQDEVDVVVDILRYCVEKVERNRRFVEYEFEVATGKTWGESKEK